MVLESIHPAAIVLLAAVLVWKLPRTIGHAVGVLAGLSAAAVSWFAPEGAHYSVDLFGTFPAVLFNVDGYSALMGLIFGFVAAVAVLYSWYSGADRVQTAFALSYVGTSFGTVFAGDWLTLIFFWELMAITSTLLVWHYGGAAVRAGFRYALLHGVGGTLLLAAIVWHYAEVGTLLFGGVAGATHDPGMAGTTAQTLAAIGIGVNVGFVGLHAWLPDTYPRPHVAASVFLCVFTTKTGVYGMFRAFPEGHLWIAYMGGAMAIFGAAVGLLQSDMRRLLSYHIQAQVGYMLAGIGIATGLATAGAFGHVLNHILYKSLLFMTVGVIIYRTGEESLHRLGGLWRAMPITAGAFAVAALASAAMPGFNAFVSKGMIVGAAHYEHLTALWYVLLIGGVGTFLLDLKLGYLAFVQGSFDGEVRDANVGQSVAMVTVAGLCVLIGVYPQALYSVVPHTGDLHYSAYTVDHLTESAAIAVASLVGYAILHRPLSRVGTVPDVDALYNRVMFVGTRWAVVAVTELYALVDRGAVRLADTAIDVAQEPERYARRVPASERVLGEPGDRHAPLRAGIGRSILLVTLVVTVVLVTVLSG